jgi:hypothetical protein
MAYRSELTVLHVLLPLGSFQKYFYKQDKGTKWLAETNTEEKWQKYKRDYSPLNLNGPFPPVTIQIVVDHLQLSSQINAIKKVC